MALGSTARGTATNNSSNTNGLTISPNGDFASNSIAVLVVAYDNSGSSGADPFGTGSVTDTLGNTWTSRHATLRDPASANAGCVLRIFTCDQNVLPLTSSTVITFTTQSNCTAKACALWEITAADVKNADYSTTGTGAGAATTTPSVTTGTITVEQLTVAAVAYETGSYSPTGDSDTTNGSWSTQQTARVGSGSTGMAVATQTKLQATANSTQTYNTTGWTVAQDWASGWIVLAEANGWTKFVTVTADADIKATISGSLAADSNFVRANTGSATADAVVLRTYSGAAQSVTADAVIKKTYEPTPLTADAVIKKTYEPTPLTADAVITRTLVHRPSGNFPGLTETGYAESTSPSSRDITLPSFVPGDLLIMAVSMDGSEAQTWTHDGATNHWSQLWDNSHLYNVRMDCRYRKMQEGDSSTVTVSWTSPNAAAWTILRIPVDDWHGTSAPSSGTAETGSTTTANPPSETASWGTGNNLAIAIAAGDYFVSIDSGPSGYTTFPHRYVSGFAGATNIVAAYKTGAGATEDPGVFTYASAEYWVAGTILVRTIHADGAPITADATIVQGATTYTFTDKKADAVVFKAWAGGATNGMVFTADADIKRERVYGSSGTNTVAQDSFTEAGSGTAALSTHTPETGTSWTADYVGSAGGILIDKTNDRAAATVPPNMSGLDGGGISVVAPDISGDVDVYLSTDDAYFGGPVVRRVSSTTYYFVQGSYNLFYLYRSTAGAWTEVASASKSIGASRYRLQASGASPTSLRLKAWLQSGSEGGSWGIDTTDNTAANQNTTGKVGIFVGSYDDGEGLIGATTADDFLATQAGGAVDGSPLTADARLTVTVSGSVTADAVIKRGQTGSGTADATVGRTVSPSFSADSVIQKTFSAGTGGGPIGVSESGGSGAGTSLGVTLPSFSTGDLLIVAFLNDASTAQNSWTYDGGTTKFTELFNQVGPSNAFRLRVCYRIMQAEDTSGGTLTVALATSRWAAWTVLKVTGWHGTTVPECGTTVTAGPASTVNPPSLDPSGWGTEDTLWLVVAGHYNNAYSSGPANFSAFTARRYGTNGGVVAMYRQNAASSEDPGNVTWSGGTYSAANTLAVRPSAGGAVGITVDASLLRTFASTTTADATVKQSAASSFTVDSVIKKSVASSATTDAVVKLSGISSSVPADASVRKTQSGSFTGAADVLRVLTGSFTGDAELLLSLVTQTGSFTADATQLVLQASTFTANAWKLGVNVYGFGADADIKRSLSGAFTADAVVRTAGAGGLTAQAVTRVSRSGSSTADAVIKRPATGDTVAAGVILRSFTTVLTADSIAKKTLTGAYTADADIFRTQTGAFTADALRRVGRAGSLPSDADVKRAASAQLTADAKVLRVETRSYSADADLKATQAASVAANAVIFALGQGQVVAAAVIKKEGQAGVGADGVIKKTVQGQLSGNADVQLSHSDTVTFDAVLRVTQAGAYSASADFRRTFIFSLSSDATFKRPSTGTVAADAVIGKTSTVGITSDSIIARTSSTSLSADSYFYRPVNGVVTADADIKSSGISSTFTARAWVQGSGVFALAADATLFGTPTGSVTAEASINRGGTGSVTASADIFGTRLGTMSADAVLRVGGSGYITSDASIARAASGSIGADAVILRTATGSVPGDAVAKRTQAASALADGVISREQTGGTSTSAVVLRTFALQSTADGVIRGGRTFSFDSSAVVLSTGMGSFSASGVIRCSGIGALLASAAIERSSSGSLTTDAWTSTTPVAVFTASAVLQRRAAVYTITASAELTTHAAGSFVADALLRRTFAGICSADAVVKSTRSATLTSDAIIAASTTHAFTTDARVRRTGTASVSADAVALAGRTSGFTADAVFGSSAVFSFTSDANLRGVFDFTADAWVSLTCAFSLTAHAWVGRFLDSDIYAHIDVDAISADIDADTIGSVLDIDAISAELDVDDIRAAIEVDSIETTFSLAPPATTVQTGQLTAAARITGVL
jgi:hypothetical protein